MKLRAPILCAVAAGSAFGCGRTDLQFVGDLELLEIVGCDGMVLGPGMEIRADRSTLPRLEFGVRVDGAQPVHGPYRLYYKLVFDRITFASDPPGRSDDVFDRLQESFGSRLTEADGPPLPPNGVASVTLEMFSMELLGSISDIVRDLSTPNFRARFPVGFQAELHALDAGGAAVCSPPVERAVVFCVDCPDAC